MSSTDSTNDYIKVCLVLSNRLMIRAVFTSEAISREKRNCTQVQRSCMNNKL